MKAIFKNKIYLGFLIILLVLLGVLVIRSKAYFDNKDAKQNILSICSNLSQNELGDCLQTKIEAASLKNPQSAAKMLDSLWSLAEQNKLNIDLRILSPTAHDVGMELIDNSIELSAAINDCGYSFKDACVHGTVMEFVDNNYQGILLKPEFVGLCDSLKSQISQLQYQDCVHGLGHEIRAKIKGDNSNLVLLCNYFPINYQNACASGIFMESSKGNVGVGYHIDTPVGSVNFDCSNIPLAYKASCYSSQGSYIEYEANSEPWEVSFKLCSSVPLAYQNDCFAGLDERLLMSESGSQEASKKVCSTLLDLENRGCMMVKEMNLSSMD